MSKVARASEPTRGKLQPILKNLFMLALSLGFVGLSIACYFSIKGAFAGGNEFNSFYNGIYLWELIFTSPEYFASAYAIDAQWAAAELVPLLIFTFAAIGAVVFLVCAILKKYFRSFALVFGALICALSVALFFVPHINLMMTAKFVGAEGAMGARDYLVSLINPQYSTLFIAPAIGVAQFAFAIAFMWTWRLRRKKSPAVQKEAQNEN